MSSLLQVSLTFSTDLLMLLKFSLYLLNALLKLLLLNLVSRLGRKVTLIGRKLEHFIGLLCVCCSSGIDLLSGKTCDWLSLLMLQILL